MALNEALRGEKAVCKKGWPQMRPSESCPLGPVRGAVPVSDQTHAGTEDGSCRLHTPVTNSEEFQGF